MNTKKLKYIIPVVVALSMSATSCKKYLELENPSTTSQDAQFSSVSYANSAVVGVYSQLIGDNGYGNRISCLYPQSADDFKTSGDLDDARRGISMYNATPTNSELLAPFNQLYKGIERANICIKYIPLSDVYLNGSASDKAAMAKLYGEALTLRAQFYYELVRNWGDLPFLTVPAADQTDPYLEKTNTDVIYDQLLEDLKTAEELVPWLSQAGGFDTRVSKAFTKGLRARIALARGGYSLRRTNKMERGTDYNKYYQIAYDECWDIIQQRGEHDLNPSYENLFKTLHTASRLDSKHEWIFEVGAFGGNASTDSKLGYYNGLKLDAASIYGAGGGGINATPTYFYEFDQTGADARRDVTLAYFEIDKNTQKILRGATDMCDGKFRRSWTTITGTAQNLAINWPIMRFADVLLMYAEAYNEINNGPTGSADGRENAVTALEEVRKRAFSSDLTRVGTTPTDKDGFFKYLVQERLLEFGGEGIRKYDLIRWNLLNTKLQETRDKLTAFMNADATAFGGKYKDVPLYIYAKAAAFANGAAGQEAKTLDLVGGANAFFVPGSGSSTAPTGYTVKNWRKAVDAEYISGDKRGWARYFRADHSEVFPINVTNLNTNYKWQQDYGY
ncbi:RagB/SusD family nutrient uptake outer membrane protein [Pedobacter sp. HMF7647]|uniref:RagB/SusD family nutrient uptake outer membrane protein n=1 Tax=Hufsiella arboris TaxID=2695275 RepID=A0A7K1Y4J1_9SPHI|nr:RagB/SusD family nutrient uptake outer membrane protein [Hufsiella arboris]MXV49496.1 RagB/SusD family nutrient uptake outer membrane protein [Hufsiella arboris]